MYLEQGKEDERGGSSLFPVHFIVVCMLGMGGDGR